MACFHHVCSNDLVVSRPLSGHGECESMAVKAKGVREKIKPHGLRDSVHVDPEHVWGDEGPVNE